MSITIDGTTYDVNLEPIDRKFDKLYKYAERTEDGVLHSEIIGVYKNYTLHCGDSIHNQADYNALIDKISEPVESNTITLFGDTYSCYFANINDKIIKDTPRSRELTFDVIAISPTRTP